MDMKEKLVELLESVPQPELLYGQPLIGVCRVADHIIANGVTVQKCAYWQYIEDEIDEDNNIQAYCSVCGAGDKHATSMIGKVPYCWKCGRKMMPEPPKGE